METELLKLEINFNNSDNLKRYDRTKTNLEEIDDQIAEDKKQMCEHGEKVNKVIKIGFENLFEMESRKTEKY